MTENNEQTERRSEVSERGSVQSQAENRLQDEVTNLRRDNSRPDGQRQDAFRQDSQRQDGQRDNQRPEIQAANDRLTSDSAFPNLTVDRSMKSGLEDKAAVNRGEGPFQVARRLMGEGANHKDVMSLTKALRDQYHDETGGKDKNLSNLKVGHKLLTNENLEKVLSKIGEKDAQARIGERLTGSAQSPRGKGDATPPPAEPAPGKPESAQGQPADVKPPEVKPPDGKTNPPSELEIPPLPYPKPDQENNQPQTEKPSPFNMEFTSNATSYFPHNSRMQGGYNDKVGNRLYTLQQYLDGKAPYVSVAMDQRVPYGTEVRIPELEKTYNNGKPIPFKVVDTGERFFNKGTNKIDICTSNRGTAYDERVNKPLTIQFVKHPISGRR